MKINKNSVLNKIAYIFLSLILICSLIIITKSDISILNTLCLWLLGFIYLSIFLILIVDKTLYDFCKIHNKIIILLGVSLISALLCIIMPFRYKQVVNDNILEKNMHNNYNINITALGEKNIESNGYEICLEGIRYDNMDYNLYNIQLNDGWSFVDGRAKYDEQEQSSLKIDLGQVNKYEIIFRKNQNSGKVSVQIGHNSFIYDLYSKEPIQRHSIDLSKILLQDQKYSNMHRIIFYFDYYIIVELIVFALVVYIIKLRDTNNSKSHKLERKND